MPSLRTYFRGARAAKPQARSRIDLLILACGLVAFLILTFVSGLGITGGPDRAGVPPGAPTLAVQGSPSPGTPGETGGSPAGDSAGASSAPTAAALAPDLPLDLPPAGAPLRIVYPSAGLDFVVHPLDPSPAEIESQSIVPPVSLDGYWLSNFGSPGAGSTNTTYIMGHSWEGRDAPFNRLSSATAPGDIFEVTTSTGQISYRVDAVSTENKSSLKDSPIWQVVPNRIVLISCYAEDLFGKNVVLVASPAPKAGP